MDHSIEIEELRRRIATTKWALEQWEKEWANPEDGTSSKVKEAVRTQKLKMIEAYERAIIALEA
jgi:hypothetical protein